MPGSCVSSIHNAAQTFNFKDTVNGDSLFATSTFSRLNASDGRSIDF